MNKNKQINKKNAITFNAREMISRVRRLPKASHCGDKKIFSYLAFKLDVCKPFGFSHLIFNQSNFSYFTKLQYNKYAFTIFFEDTYELSTLRQFQPKKCSYTIVTCHWFSTHSPMTQWQSI